MICLPGPAQTFRHRAQMIEQDPQHLCKSGHQPENESWVVEDNMTKLAAGFSENRDSTDNLVRDLEESGYPVDGAKEQFAPQPDSLTAESDRSEFVLAQPEGAHKISIVPTGKR